MITVVNYIMFIVKEEAFVFYLLVYFVHAFWRTVSLSLQENRQAKCLVLFSGISLVCERS